MSYEKVIDCWSGDNEVIVQIDYEYSLEINALKLIYHFIIPDPTAVLPMKVNRKEIDAQIHDWLEKEMNTYGQHYVDEYHDNSDELYDNWRSEC